MLHPGHRRSRASQGGVIRYAELLRRRTNRKRILDRAFVFDRINDERDFLALDHIHNMRPTLRYFVDDLYGQAFSYQKIRRTAGGTQGETQFQQLAGHFHHARLIQRLNADEHFAGGRQLNPRRNLRL